MPSLRTLARTLRIEAHSVWLAARDPAVPWPARLFGLLIAAYALSPIDLIPDFIPVIGLLDDAVLIPLGVWLFLKMVPNDVYARCRAEAERAAERPVSWAGAALIGLFWLAVIAGVIGVLWPDTAR